MVPKQSEKHTYVSQLFIKHSLNNAVTQVDQINKFFLTFAFEYQVQAFSFKQTIRTFELSYRENELRSTHSFCGSIKRYVDSNLSSPLEH